MEKELRTLIDELFFSKEAAEYLGVSPQRLNQLVHAKKIIPIKQGASGTLFLKADLDSRIQELNHPGTSMIHKENGGIMLETPFMNEAINYFTIQRFYNFSDKKTEPVFFELSKRVDLTKNMRDIYKEICDILDFSKDELSKNYKVVEDDFKSLDKDDVVLKKGTVDYPALLGITKEAPQYLFLRGNIELLSQKKVSVVGSRQPSEDGKKKAYLLSKMLGSYGMVVVSGLAKGIDTAAHTAAIENGFKTIAVLGTPLTVAYPSENAQLQTKIAKSGLLVSQFPPSTPVQRWHFPMRNAVMSGISLATAVVEAGETSGALKQADYAIKQDRLVFIPQSALDNEKITWPNKYLQRKGAYKFSTINELIQKLEEVKVIVGESQEFDLLTEGVEFSNVR